jgi:hypothetical protein
VKTADDVSELSQIFLECRDRGHAWFDERSGPSLRRSSGGLVLRSLRCLRCKTLREDQIIATSGEIYGRRYQYPEGYLFTRGTERVARSDVRKLAVRAAFAALKKRRSA